MLVVVTILLVGDSLASPMMREGQDGNRVEKRLNKRFISEGIKLWPSTTIPYKFDTKHPVTAKDKEIALNSMKHIQQHTCLKFIEKSTSKTGLKFDQPPGLVGACRADIGYQTEGYTGVHLPKRCGDLPAVVHEIFHALGHSHEQGSSYRYRYTIVNWGVLSEDDRADYAAKPNRFKEDIDPYDVYSVMHYAIINKQFDPMMILLNPRLDDFYLDDPKGETGIGDMGRSMMDFKKMNTIYKCTDSCKDMKCENTGYATKTQNDCHCVCPKHLSGEKCEEFKPIGSKKNCDKMFKLSENQKITITSPKDKTNPNTYMRGARCIYFIKATPGLRVKATITNLQLTVTQSINSFKTCIDHWVGFSISSVSNNVYKYCGSIPRPGKKQEVFLKSTLTKEANLMTIIFDSMSNFGNGRDVNINGSGITLEVTAYRSGCITMGEKCRPPSTCVDSEDMKSSKCVCSDGYSGPTCSDVKKDSVVTTDFDNNMKRLSFFKVDPTSTNVRFNTATELSETTEGKTTKFVPTKNSYVFGTFSSIQIGEKTEGRLTTDGINFEAGKRCLSFKYLLHAPEKGQTASSFSVWVSGEGVKKRRLWKQESSKNSTWEKAQVSIDSMKNLKIMFEHHEEEPLANAVEDFVLQPTCSGPCFPNPCKNSGRCSLSGSDIKCSCTYGYSGNRCEIRPCPDKYCENGGICYVKNGQSACRCRIPFKGPRCEKKICKSDKCVHGSCEPVGEDIVPQYKCECNPGWLGPNCDKAKTVVDLCKPNPCQNGGTCDAFSGTVSCSCDIGYHGKHCEKKICTSNTCAHGDCTEISADKNPPYECTCSAGWSGQRCDKKAANLCKPNPCKNGGECEFFGGAVTCSCQIGYSGRRCEKSVCDGVKCHNGGTCQPFDVNPYCECQTGFTGDRCEKKDNSGL